MNAAGKIVIPARHSDPSGVAAGLCWAGTATFQMTRYTSGAAVRGVLSAEKREAGKKEGR